MKKIFLAVTTDLNYDQRMQRICTTLAQADYQVLLMGRTWPESLPLLPRTYKQHRLNCFFNKGKLFYLEYSIRLFCYLLFKAFDAFVAIDLDTAVPLYVKARLSKKAFVYDAHEYFTEVVEVVNRPIIQKTWLAIERFILSRTRFAYTVNDSLARLFYNRYQVPFAVIRNCPILEPDLTLPAPNSRDYLLYQGALNEGRGLEQLLQAMVLVDKKLVLCGKGDKYDYLKKLSKDLGLQDKVIFKNYVRPEELKQITRNAFLGINLLENWGLNYYYSLGNKFFDYLHAGVPQLVVDFPEYQQLNNQWEVAKIVILDPETIATAINQLIHDAAYYDKLVQNCLIARQHWNWQNEEKKLLDFYKTIWGPAPKI
ncbi:glycosyltransferase [Adhaeribacter swui]|uniref:Glycosyltransferase n=1 Tax=Adhaeribacter swui TaxID=2086471 RepID=A0A7G7G8V4_9BACT|nr:glycosyltransferase [Adhaeribacter swui]QNF33588.1 glycosyltransferase [Adhaeribacter swui]